MIREIFAAVDADIILDIPLISPSARDELTWHFTKDGNYSVRSAYYIELLEEGNQNVTSVSEETKPLFWRKLWKLNVSPRCKNFLWRAARNILPTKSKLVRRKVTEDWCCAWCGREKDSIHVLKDCWKAKNLWRHSQFQGLVKRREGEMREWFEAIMEQLSLPLFEEFAMMLWMVWYVRNKRIFERKEDDPREVIRRAVTWLDEYRKQNNSQLSLPNSTRCKRWKLPDHGCIKINCDTRVSAMGKAQIGVVAHDSDGGIVLFGAKKCEGRWSVKNAESEAIRWVLEAARDHGLQRIVVETDSLIIFNRFQDDCSKIGLNSSIMDLIKQQQMFVQLCSWSHVCREGNRVADAISDFDFGSLFISQGWLDIPPTILDVITADCNNSL